MRWCAVQGVGVGTRRERDGVEHVFTLCDPCPGPNKLSSHALQGNAEFMRPRNSTLLRKRPVNEMIYGWRTRLLACLRLCIPIYLPVLHLMCCVGLVCLLHLLCLPACLLACLPVYLQDNYEWTKFTT